MQEVNKDCIDLQNGKVEKSDFDLFQKKLGQQLETLSSDLDSKEAKIKSMERFIDKYIPIRIQS